jgi:hypothetical protein
MPGIELIRSLFQQASAQGSRSTALNPLGWAFATVLSALIGAKVADAPQSIITLLSVFASLILAVFLFAYIYFMFKQPDALRSEKFTLSKMAIEKSVIGDSLKGFKELPVGDQKALQSAIEVTGQQELR